MTVGYDQLFQFAPQFGKYQIYVFVVAYLTACIIFGPMLTAGVFFQVLEVFINIPNIFYSV